MPRLVRGALSRQYKGAWNLTTANAWGVLALEKFSKKFEAVPVSGVSSSILNRAEKSINWDKSADGGKPYVWLAQGKRETDHHTSGHRETVGYPTEHCCNSVKRAVFKRI